MDRATEIFRKKIGYKNDGDFKLWSEVVVTECMKEIAIEFAIWINQLGDPPMGHEIELFKRFLEEQKGKPIV
jgi:hypothetical protein